MVERFFIVLFLFAFTNAHEVLLFGPRDEILGLVDVDVRMVMRYSWIVLYAPLLILISLGMRQVTTIVRSDVWLALLLVMCALSTAWSIAGEETLRRSLALFMTAGFGYYVAALYQPVSQLRMLAVALTLATGIGLAAGLLVPEVGVMSVLHPGAWRGVFVNKNQFGAIAAINCVTLLVLWMLNGAPRAWLALALIASLTALLLSESLTALATTTSVATVLVFVAMARRHHSVASMLVFGSLCAALGILLVSSADTVLAWSGRDPTLTGRTLIWREAWELVVQRPLLGYGYGAFWVDGSEAASRLQEAVRWSTPTAHNGYLDLLLELGVVGLTLFGLSASTTIFRILARVRSIERTLLLSCCASISFVLIYNLVESAMLEQHHLLTYLYVWAAAAARRDDIVARRASLAERLSP